MTVDATAAVWAASYLIGLNQLISNVQPLILGALADGYGLSDRQLGHVSSAFVAATTVAVLSAPWWVRRVDWRAFSFGAVVLASLALAGGARASSYAGVLALFVVVGFLKGFVGAPSFASLGDSRNPDRAYGVSLVAQMVVSGSAAYPIASYVLPNFGVPGLMITLAAIIGTGLLACLWLPVRGREREQADAAALAAPIVSRANVPAFVALLALALFIGGILLFWYFCERIGVVRGVSKALIGIAVSGCSIATIATAAVVAWLGGRVRSAAFIWSGTAMAVAALLLLRLPGDLAYVFSVIVFAMAWGLAQPGYWTILRNLDVSDRLFVIAPAASGAGGVAVGLIAGPLIESGGYGLLVAVSGGLLVLGLVTSALAERFGRANRAV